MHLLGYLQSRYVPLIGSGLEDGEGRILVEKLRSGTIEAQHVGYDEEDDEEDDEGEPDVIARPWPWRRSATLLVLLSFSLFFFGYLGGQFKRSHSQPAIRARKCESIATRREWRTLSRQEKSDFIDAVTCLASAPSKQVPDDSLYDDFAYVHIDTGETSYNSPLFLPYHRHLLHAYERELKVSCGYSGNLPYWDWALDWEDLPASPVFSNTSGFGGIDGIGDNPCVTDGPLANLHLPYYGKEHPNCIWRALPTPENAHQPNKEVLPIDQMSPSMVETLLAQETYDGFLAQLQTGPRISIPNGIAGDFMEFTAPNDPLFFLHHSQLDRVWWRWQQDNPDRRLTEYSGEAVTGNIGSSVMDTIALGVLASDVKVLDIMDTEAGELCYRY